MCRSDTESAVWTGKSNNTLSYFVNNGKNASEKTAARKVLRQACDNGGDKACNYIVTACQRDSNLCDTTNTANGYDLRYYLELLPGTSGSSVDASKFLISDYAKPLYNSGNINIKNAVDNICCSNLPNVNMACYIKGPTECRNGYASGYNAYGQLADKTWSGKPRPTPMSGNITFSQVSAGYDYACGIEKITGKAYCWGYNSYGQLGDNTTNNRSVPTAVSGGLTFIDIAAGTNHTCGIETSGKAYFWGVNDAGELGDNSIVDKHTPAAVVGTDGQLSTALNYSQISSYNYSTCALTSSGTAYCWGYNPYGQLGNNGYSTKNYPRPVSGGLSFSQISVGRNFQVGIRKPYFSFLY